MEPYEDPTYGPAFRLAETATPFSFIAVHSVYLGSPAEVRNQRLATETTADNRISQGCINVPTNVAAKFGPMVASGDVAADSKIYVLPDTNRLTDVFPVGDTLSTTAGETTAYEFDPGMKPKSDREAYGKQEGLEPTDPYARKAPGKKPRYASARELGRDLVNEFGGKTILAAINSGRLRVYESEADPRMTAKDRAIVAALKSTGEADISGFYEPDDDSVVIIASNTAKADGIKAAIHEAGVHAGWKAILGDAMYSDAMSQIENALMSTQASPFRTAVQEAHEAALERAARSEHVAEERLAYLAERYPDMPLMRRILAAVRNWLRTKGIVTKFTADDLASLARGVAGKWMVQGGAKSAAAPKARVGTNGFNQWFKDSKVVDANGEPLRVYRGVDKDYGPTMRVGKTAR